MQYKPMLLVLFMLYGMPNIVLAQSLSAAPIFIFSSGLIVLLALAIYVGIKIRQNLKKCLDEPAR